MMQTYFLGRRRPGCLRVATAHDLYRIMLTINVYTDFELLEVKVPLIFLGTVGFSPRGDGH